LKLTYLTLILLLLFSCAKKHKGEQSTSLLSNFVSITDNEDKGVKDVLDFYGGYCEYAIGTSFSTDEGKKKYFELKLTKSEVADKFANVREFTASNMAYMFYKDLKNEKKNYDEIHSVLILNGKDKYEYKYSHGRLDTISAKLKVFNKVFESIKGKKYDQLKTILSNDSYKDSDKNQMVLNLKKIDTAYGNIKGVLIYGFRFERQNEFDVLTILGVFLRDKQNNPITIKVDLNSSDDKIHFLDYTVPQN
jgi:hypothetical protein